MYCITIFFAVIFVVLSVLVTVLCMCARETLGSSSSKTGDEEKELLEHMDTSSSSDSEL